MAALLNVYLNRASFMPARRDVRPVRAYAVHRLPTPKLVMAWRVESDGKLAANWASHVPAVLKDPDD
jgi:hypothetical protein